LLAEASEEDDVECLGIFSGTATRLSASIENPVPNMGWCPTRSLGEHHLLRGIDDGTHFYYVHSYALPVAASSVATASHDRDFTAVACRDNFAAAQFHPERSSAAGLQLLRNFLEWRP
ncbi:MAG: imidazole glycerol phosphate synthase subunit HisH, partial [Woeseiaceae bacterium]